MAESGKAGKVFDWETVRQILGEVRPYRRRFTQLLGSIPEAFRAGADGFYHDIRRGAGQEAWGFENLAEFDETQTEVHRIIFAVDLSYHWQPAYDGVTNLGPRPDLRLQVTPVQQCVDLRTTESSPMAVWLDIGKARLHETDTTSVSEALDRLLAVQLGEGDAASAVGVCVEALSDENTGAATTLTIAALDDALVPQIEDALAGLGWKLAWGPRTNGLY